MAYKENEVVAKYTKGNSKSDCGKYSTEDLLEMFDQAEETVVPCSAELDYEFYYEFS
jgi:hypothetical protein